VAVTEYLRADLVKQFEISPKKTLTLHDSVELERFNSSITKELARKKLGLTPNTNLVVYTGKLSAEKGIDTLLNAASMLKDVQIIIVGSSTEHDNEKWRKFADEIGANNVNFVGFVPPHEISSYLKSADVLVLPQSSKTMHSTYYTSPLKLFEYMASERPITASRLPVLQEILVDEQNALLYTADDPVALAEAVKRLMADAQLCRKLSEQASKDVQHYTWIHRAEHILQAIGFSDYESVEKLTDF